MASVMHIVQLNHLVQVLQLEGIVHLHNSLHILFKCTPLVAPTVIIFRIRLVSSCVFFAFH